MSHPSKHEGDVQEGFPQGSDRKDLLAGNIGTCLQIQHLGNGIESEARLGYTQREFKV